MSDERGLFGGLGCMKWCERNWFMLKYIAYKLGNTYKSCRIVKAAILQPKCEVLVEG